MDESLVFTGPDWDNWLYRDWYRDGANSRYPTWQITFNLLNQRFRMPRIVETGCQRLKEDLGGGMSTSLFCEYIGRYGGQLASVDLSPQSISAAQKVTRKYNVDKQFFTMDSVKFLEGWTDPIDLIYLDSWDYPYGQMLNAFGGQKDLVKAEEELKKLDVKEVLERFKSIIDPCQEHCLKEMKAVEKNLHPKSIVLIDDNQLPGGGKPRLAKEYLAEQGWVCLMDFQQSLWIRSI